MSDIKTPYYLIDEAQLQSNLEKVAYLREMSGTKSVLALKCFSTWSTFRLIREYMDGTTSSSLYEARLGNEKFGKEVHAYSVAFSKEDIDELNGFADKVIFNSINQLTALQSCVSRPEIGLRVNPQVSYSGFDLADPARKFSRLGETEVSAINDVAEILSGMMFHYNCENGDFGNFSSVLDQIANTYGSIFKKLKWVSLGGGVLFTSDDYPIDLFAKKLKQFSEQFEVEVYLEPGEAVVRNTACLVTRVLDVVHNEADIAIVDSSIEAHMLDLLVYRDEAPLEHPGPGENTYIIAGQSCLAGDVFGTYKVDSPICVGDEIRLGNAAAYTMVKKNWFNGVKMPSIVIRKLNGEIELVKKFTYDDYLSHLS